MTSSSLSGSGWIALLFEHVRCSVTSKEYFPWMNKFCSKKFFFNHNRLLEIYKQEERETPKRKSAKVKPVSAGKRQTEQRRCATAPRPARPGSTSRNLQTEPESRSEETPSLTRLLLPAFSPSKRRTRQKHIAGVDNILGQDAMGHSMFFQRLRNQYASATTKDDHAERPAEEPSEMGSEVHCYNLPPIEIQPNHAETLSVEAARISLDPNSGSQNGFDNKERRELYVACSQCHDGCFSVVKEPATRAAQMRDDTTNELDQGIKTERVAAKSSARWAASAARHVQLEPRFVLESVKIERPDPVADLVSEESDSDSDCVNLTSANGAQVDSESTTRSSIWIPSVDSEDSD